ncbi:hypothetical protein QLX08_004938 [Tetragonisca angustula]|uniref:Uncharacterized protein n=1 Tax=Tetragonisca angustula TaxID=166442 RepID=A0AAW1A0F8_9HYME
MAGCSALVVSRSAQVASTRSKPQFALIHADIALSSRATLFHVTLSSPPLSCPAAGRPPVQLNAATETREDLDQVAEGA